MDPECEKQPADYHHPDTAQSKKHCAGVQRVQAVSAVTGTWHKTCIFLSLFLFSFARALDGSVRSTFQGYATASYSEHSLLATIGVVRSIVAAALQPAFAKTSDLFGRNAVLIFSVIVYAMGTVIEATAGSVRAFAGGALLYEIGYTGSVLFMQVFIADMTSLRNRLLGSFIPSAPDIITVWVSGNLVDSVLSSASWTWGIGMWAIIFPVCTCPLLLSLWLGERKARKEGILQPLPSPWKTLTNRSAMIELFWQIDLIGLLLLCASLALILLPFTLAGGVTRDWKQPHVLATLLVGFLVALPAFVVWETKVARHPLLPVKLFRDRTLLAGFCIGGVLNGCWYLQGDYFYPVLVVAFDQSELSAQRIASMYGFVSSVVGVFLGLAVRYLRRVKKIIIVGGVLYTVAFGLIVEYRSNSTNVGGIIGGQFLLGFAGGMVPFSAQALVQATTRHENMAIITSLYYSNYYIAASIGATISGAIWTQLMYDRLQVQLQEFGAGLAEAVYDDPYATIQNYPLGTPERAGMIRAYQSVQRLLGITGLAISTVIIIASFFLKDYHLSDEQSRPEAELESVSDKQSIETQQR